PPPTFTTKVVKYEDKELLLVQVAPSTAVVHVVKELGPFIRANGSNRTPTSHELELLQMRRAAGGIMPLYGNFIDNSSDCWRAGWRVALGEVSFGFSSSYQFLFP